MKRLIFAFLLCSIYFVGYPQTDYTPIGNIALSQHELPQDEKHEPSGLECIKYVKVFPTAEYTVLKIRKCGKKHYEIYVTETNNLKHLKK